MAPAPLHIIIIGGGIGGLCLAQALKRADISVAVYERNPARVWPEGYRIHINPVGSRALYECLPVALWETFIAIASKPPAGLGFLTEQLEQLVVIGEEFMANTTGNLINAHYPVNRIALRHLLLASMQDVIQFDKVFEHYEQCADSKVTAFFADGTSATGDVLVAADGANSRVRQQYLPYAQRVEIGAAGIGGKLALTEQSRTWLPRQLLSRMNLTLAPSRYTLFNAPFAHAHHSAEARTRIEEQAHAVGLNPELLIDGGQDYMLWGFIAPANTYPYDIHNFDGYALQRLVSQRIAAWHPDLRRLVADSDPASMSFNPFKTMLPTARWKSTNITLLGDAIHNMPPVGGLGGNMALRDASVLARKLTAAQRGELLLQAAIQQYEAEMRAYGFAAVDAVLENTRLATSDSRIAREVGKTWFRLCNAVPPLKRVFEERWTRPMRV